MNEAITKQQERISELEAAIGWGIERLKAVQWVGLSDFADELRTRAFPPKFEEVRIHGWANPRNNDFYMERKPEYVTEELMPATLNFQRPIVAETVNQFKEGMLAAAQHAMNKACTYSNECDRSIGNEVAHYIKSKAEELA